MLRVQFLAILNLPSNALIEIGHKWKVWIYCFPFEQMCWNITEGKFLFVYNFPFEIQGCEEQIIEIGRFKYVLQNGVWMMSPNIDRFIHLDKKLSEGLNTSEGFSLIMKVMSIVKMSLKLNKIKFIIFSENTHTIQVA